MYYRKYTKLLPLKEIRGWVCKLITDPYRDVSQVTVAGAAGY